MTIGVRKLSRFFILWAGFLLAEVVLAVLFTLFGTPGSAVHLALAGALLLAALVAGHRLMYCPRPRKVPVLMYLPKSTMPISNKGSTAKITANSTAATPAFSRSAVAATRPSGPCARRGGAVWTNFTRMPILCSVRRVNG